MISNFLNNPLLQQYLNRNFAQPVDTGMPVQNKLYQQPFNMFDVSGGITNIPTNINQQPFSDYYGPNNIDTSFGVANEEDVEEDVEGARQTGGLADLFRAAIGFAVPGAGLLMGAGRGILGGIQSLNQKLRGTTFGMSPTLKDYVQAKKAEKRAAAGADVGVSGGGRGSRRGDADISGPRGGFATDDTAGFF